MPPPTGPMPVPVPPKCSKPSCRGPMPKPPSMPGATYNNYGSGGAGSYNFGRKKREAQTYNNYGSGGAGSYNFGRKKREAQTYTNHGSGGIGSTNFYGGNSNNWGYSYPSFPTPMNPFAYSGFPFYWYPNFLSSYITSPWSSSSTYLTSSLPTTSSSTFTNYGSGGAGSHNFGRKRREAQWGSGAVNYGNNFGHMYGRKKREAQTYINHGSGGAGSTNYNYGSSYNNFGSGGAGNSNHNHIGGSFNYGSNFGSMWG